VKGAVGAGSSRPRREDRAPTKNKNASGSDDRDAGEVIIVCFMLPFPMLSLAAAQATADIS
jgi:hypothetical protein